MTSEHDKICLIYCAIVLHVLFVLLKITRPDLTQGAGSHILKSKPNDFVCVRKSLSFRIFGNR